MWWTIAAGVLRTALNAYDAFGVALTAGSFPEEPLKEILSAADITRLLIYQQAGGTWLARKTGEAARITAWLSFYRRCELTAQPEQWTEAGERLRAVTSSAARLLKDLQAELDRLNLYSPEELEYGTKVFTLYAVLIPAHAAALLERGAIYHAGTAADAQQVFGPACAYVEQLLRALRRASDAQFSPDFVTRLGAEYGFTCGSDFILVGAVPPGANPAPVIKQARSRLQQRREVVFAAYPGAAPLIQFKEYADRM